MTAHMEWVNSDLSDTTHEFPLASAEALGS